MKKQILFLGTAVLALALTGCQSTQNIDTDNDHAGAVMGLDYRDFNKVASEMLQDLFRSQRLVKRDGGRYVMACAVIKNDTLQRIDTDLIMSKIKSELINSGQVAVTAAIGQGTTIDSNLQDVRDQRNNAEFNQSTVVGSGNLIAPDLSIGGKIYQRNVHMDGSSVQAEYYFQLRIVEIKTGLVFWEKEVFLGKRGSEKNAAWN